MRQWGGRDGLVISNIPKTDLLLRHQKRKSPENRHYEAEKTYTQMSPNSTRACGILVGSGETSEERQSKTSE